MRRNSPYLLAILLGVAFGQPSLWSGMPEGYDTAVQIDDADLAEFRTALTADILKAFPYLRGRFSTDLEKEVFLGTAEADSLRALLKARRTEVLATPYLLKVSSRLPKFDVEKRAFSIRLSVEHFLGCKSGIDVSQAERVALERYLRHTVRGIWFDRLSPLVATTWIDGVHQYLRLEVTNAAQALALEQDREYISVWLGFELTGAVEKTSKGWDKRAASLWGGTWESLRAKKPAVFFVNSSNEIVLYRKLW